MSTSLAYDSCNSTGIGMILVLWAFLTVFFRVLFFVSFFFFFFFYQ